MNNVLNALQRDLLFDIESNVISKLNTIVKELKIGKTASLQKMSYFICGDPTAMKVYEIESYLINEELSQINSSQLSMLWLATDNGEGYEDTDLDELPYEAYDVFNYVYNNIDMYDSYYYSEYDFLKLLDRQCWLKTTLEECEISYRQLHDEIIDLVEYDDFNLLIPNFVCDIEDVQFYYIYGKGIHSLSFKEYEKHLLYKLISVIEKEKINESFFRELSGSYEGFDYFWDNWEFYSLLPPIYFAQKIMETEEFRFSLDFHIDKKIEFISLYSEIIANMADENDEKFNEFTLRILDTTIFEISTYGSYYYNQIVYNNSDQRYDHDLSRFLQYSHTLKNSNEEGTRLSICTSLKKELEDEHNTISSSIENFIEKEFPEYKNNKYTLNAVKSHIPFSDVATSKHTLNAVKPHVPFAELVTTQKNTDNKSETIQDLSSKNNNVKEKYNEWRDWWRWPLVPLASIGGGFLVYLIFILIQWLNAYMFGAGFLDQWTFLYILPALAKSIFGFTFGYMSYLAAPRGKEIASNVMISLLFVWIIADIVLTLNNSNFTLDIKVLVVFSNLFMIAGSIYGAKKAHEDN